MAGGAVRNARLSCLFDPYQIVWRHRNKIPRIGYIVVEYNDIYQPGQLPASHHSQSGSRLIIYARCRSVSQTQAVVGSLAKLIGVGLSSGSARERRMWLALNLIAGVDRSRDNPLVQGPRPRSPFSALPVVSCPVLSCSPPTIPIIPSTKPSFPIDCHCADGSASIANRTPFHLHAQELLRRACTACGPPIKHSTTTPAIFSYSHKPGPSSSVVILG